MSSDFLPTIAFIYMLIGVIFVCFHPEIKGLSSTIENPKKWNAYLFYITVYVVTIIIWPITISGWIKTSREIKTKQNLSDILELMNVFPELSDDNVKSDSFPEGYGAYGLESTNPVPCMGILGSTSYLSRIRTENGISVLYRRVGSSTSPVSDSPVDRYEIMSAEEKNWLLSIFLHIRKVILGLLRKDLFY